MTFRLARVSVSTGRFLAGGDEYPPASESIRDIEEFTQSNSLAISLGEVAFLPAIPHQCLLGVRVMKPGSLLQCCTHRLNPHGKAVA
jgi:hypothetical protein